MKSNVIAMNGTDSGSWVALCSSHAARYAREYTKTVTADPGFWCDCTPPECCACIKADDLASRHRGGYIDLADMERINSRAGCHFFSEGAMKSFSCTVPDAGRFLPGDSLTVVFITSEKRTGFRAPDGPRRYTVRVMDCLTGYIAESPSGFQGHATLNAARKEMARLLVAGRVEVAA